MSNFVKHVGKVGDRKVAVLFREVPNEEHMCLVIHPETLPAAWHDAIMKVLESDKGQQSENLADALHAAMLPDSRLILETLHNERMIKKVRTADVIMTPNAQASIRLDELNKMLNEMKKGDEAIKKLAENDASRGLVDPAVKRGAEERYKAEQAARNQQAVPAESFVAPQDGALSDRQLAANMVAQAKRMEAEAKGMIAEASRMKKEAEKLDPRVDPANAIETPTQAEVSEPVVEKRGRGRPPKTANE